MKALLALPALFLSASVFASDVAPRQGFWGSVDIGFGSLHLDPSVAAASTGTRFYLGLSGGYTVHPQLQLGLEASGWNIRASNLWDSNKGEGLMQLFAVARYWPTTDSKLFIKMAAGNVSHWNNDSGATKGTGNGYTLGLGYELARFAGAETYWFLDYSAGSMSGYTPPGGVKQDEDYSALTAGVSLGF